MRRHRLIVVLYGWILLLSGQAQQIPLGAIVEGKVVDDLTNQPIENARIVLDLRGLSGERETQTDERGIFTFADVVAGQYNLQANRADYLIQTYGWTAPERLSKVFTVQPGGRYSLPLRLLKPAKVSGRIYDIEGQRMPGVEVKLMTASYGGFAQRSLDTPRTLGTPTGFTVKSDANGEYLFQKVPPGTFYIRAVTVNGSIAPTYYPGVESPDLAGPVIVTGGTDFRALDFTISPSSGFTISGKIVNALSEADPSRYEYYLAPRGFRLMEGGLPRPSPNQLTSTNEFEFQNVSRGSYELFVGYRTGNRTASGSPEYFVGRSTIDIVDRDVAELTVIIDPGTDIPGQIILDDAAKAANPNMRTFVPMLFTADGMPGIMAPRAVLAPQSDSVQHAGTFRVTHAPRGQYSMLNFGLGGPDSNLYLAVARLGAEDILGRRFNIDAKTEGPFVLEFSGSGARFEGTVVDSNREPVSGAQVVLIPPINFRDDLTAYKTGTTDAQGRFFVAGIRPGTYTALAFAEIDSLAWMDPEVFGPRLGSGVTIDLGKNQRLQMELPLITP